MRRILSVLVSLALTVACASQEPVSASPVPAPSTTEPTAEARPGDALLVRIPRSEPGPVGEAVLRSPSGAVLQRASGFRLGPGTEWEVFVFGLPMDAPVGTYTVEFFETIDGRVSSSRQTVIVHSRDFLAEDIPLTSDLTSLRAEPSSRKDQEARIYAEVLGRVDPEGVWLDAPFLRPIASERRTSHFGDRRRYLYATGGTASAIHAGIDFAAPTGTPIKAAGRGRVVLASDREITGKTVVLEHLPGVYTIYMHMETLSVAVGAVLERGARLGTVGSTGLATGPHLHWELRVRGVACDPETPAFLEFPGKALEP